MDRISLAQAMEMLEDVRTMTPRKRGRPPGCKNKKRNSYPTCKAKKNVKLGPSTDRVIKRRPRTKRVDYSQFKGDFVLRKSMRVRTESLKARENREREERMLEETQRKQKVQERNRLAKIAKLVLTGG
ncbi:hypothetical protein DFH27DRAFT_528166 [Peziza echinospora]|nr:hypothetical protein DFH27DRAFT_528166 [Peziza echinospora]